MKAKVVYVKFEGEPAERKHLATLGMDDEQLAQNLAAYLDANPWSKDRIWVEDFSRQDPMRGDLANMADEILAKTLDGEALTSLDLDLVENACNSTRRITDEEKVALCILWEQVKAGQYVAEPYAGVFGLLLTHDLRVWFKDQIVDVLFDDAIAYEPQQLAEAHELGLRCLAMQERGLAINLRTVQEYQE